MQEKFIKDRHILKYDDNQLKNVKLGITTREEGYSHYPKDAFNMARYINDDQDNVTRHQALLASVIQFPRNQWVFPIQTHENKVVEITNKDKGTNIDSLSNALHGIDGMYTFENDILLTMCYADCVPIYFIAKTSLCRLSSCRLAWHSRSNCQSNVKMYTI